MIYELWNNQFHLKLCVSANIRIYLFQINELQIYKENQSLFCMKNQQQRCKNWVLSVWLIKATIQTEKTRFFGSYLIYHMQKGKHVFIKEQYGFLFLCWTIIDHLDQYKKEKHRIKFNVLHFDYSYKM